MKVGDLIYQKRGFNHQNGNRQPMWDIYRGVKNFGNMYRYRYIYIYIIYIYIYIIYNIIYIYIYYNDDCPVSCSITRR